MYVCMHASSTWVQERGQAAAATEENARTLLEELHACRDDVEVRFEAMRRQEEEMRDAVAAVAALEATLAALGPPRQGAGVLGELQNTLGHVRSDDSAAERSLLTVGGLKVRLRTPWPAVARPASALHNLLVFCVCTRFAAALCPIWSAIQHSDPSLAEAPKSCGHHMCILVLCRGHVLVVTGHLVSSYGAVKFAGMR